ncbi:hypothetical protein B0F90DRAFT_1683580 [Multifurca ochricompacta]|uniref:Uncharacterized protein n=1 Tax=Multifurca ochricompacta TaxID=376703 RepID=A0AAD4MAS4_9AGAM|nr:hypothetical protein B0F90DRAFT_1683580 [Multifurca ochricompacta]
MICFGLYGFRWRFPVHDHSFVCITTSSRIRVMPRQPCKQKSFKNTHKSHLPAAALNCSRLNPFGIKTVQRSLVYTMAIKVSSSAFSSRLSEASI